LPDLTSQIGTLVRVEGLYKAYRKGDTTVSVLRGLNLQVEKGEFLAIVGASGSGKSTLLHLLGALDVPDAGAIIYAGQRVDRLSVTDRDRLRNTAFGFVFQFYHLLPELTVLENVLAPVMIRYSLWQWWHRRRHWRRQALSLLERCGLAARRYHYPQELSGGEMQRAAIARALLTGPQLLLADEPTGNLDADAATQIMHLLHDLNRENTLTIIMVTHNWELAKQAHRMLRMADGRLEPVPGRTVPKVPASLGAYPS